MSPAATRSVSEEGEPARLRWDLPVWVVVNAALASIPVAIAGQPGLLLFTIVPALLLTVILLMVPDHIAGRVGFVVGIVLIATSALSAVTAQIPIAAVLALSAVVFFTSLPPKPAVFTLGNFVALGYLIYAWMGPPIIEAQGLEPIAILSATTAATVITVTAMMLTTMILARLSPRRATELEEAREASGAGDRSSLDVRTLLRRDNPLLRYAVVRALAFGAIMASTFSMRGDRSGFWVLLAMIIVSVPTGKAAWRAAAERVAATLLGVAAFLVAFALLPEVALLALAALILLAGLMWIERSNVVMLACATVFVIALAGVAEADYVRWAVSRLLDTAVGALIGVGVSMLGEPRPRTTDPDAAGPRSV
jgi:hypothetical protein